MSTKKRHAVTIELNEQQLVVLESLISTGFWGNTLTTATKRLLDLKLYELTKYETTSRP